MYCKILRILSCYVPTIAVPDSQFLITFLRGCKFSLERTKAKMDMYYTLRTALPEFYLNRDPMLPEIQAILKAG